ncbi:MAG: universal stress protein [Hyphomonadaceae bacterium]
MSLKSIMAVASGESDDGAVIGVGAKLAAAQGGELRVVPAFADPAADLIYYGAALYTTDASVADRLAESEQAAHERLEALGREAASREGASVRVDRRALQPAVALAPAAVLADVVAFGAAGVKAAAMGALFAETLLSTRAPVLLVKRDTLGAGPVAVAWDGSAQAARAVRAALPLLRGAPRVLILRNVDDESAEAEAGGVADLKRYLALHGVKAAEARELHGERVAESLLAAVKAEGCDLLVAGAYGRPRLFEMVLGGTTRALVQAADGPNLFLAH